MMTYSQQDIKALKERRMLSRITMRELHETAGLTLTRYASIEGGHELPTREEWYAIDNAFYTIDQQQAFDAGKYLFSGSEVQTEARRKLARWNTAAKADSDLDTADTSK